jgi:hypothetical protein
MPLDPMHVYPHTAVAPELSSWEFDLRYMCPDIHIPSIWRTVVQIDKHLSLARQQEITKLFCRMAARAGGSTN